MAKLDDLVDELSRRKKQLIAVLADTIMLPVALWCAFALRLGEFTPEVMRNSGPRFWSACAWPSRSSGGSVCTVRWCATWATTP